MLRFIHRTQSLGLCWDIGFRLYCCKLWVPGGLCSFGNYSKGLMCAYEKHSKCAARIAAVANRSSSTISKAKNGGGLPNPKPYTLALNPKASLFKAAPSESHRGHPKPVPGTAMVNVRALKVQRGFSGTLSQNYVATKRDINISSYSGFLISTFRACLRLGILLQEAFTRI